MRMLLEESKGEWRIALGEEKAKGKGRELELELFYVARLKRGMVGKRLIVSEIEDFQSSVMLSRTEVRGKEVVEAVMNFVESFAWCKVLCEVMMEIEVIFFFLSFFLFSLFSFLFSLFSFLFSLFSFLFSLFSFLFSLFSFSLTIPPSLNPSPRLSVTSVSSLTNPPLSPSLPTTK